MARALLTLALFVGLSLLTLAGMAGLTLRERLIYPPELEIARAGEVDIPAHLRKDLLSIIDTGPLDQVALNMLFSLEVRDGAEPSRLADLLEPLGDLGWRSTAAQRNLVYEALLAGDLEEGIRRIDALLRRDRLREEIVPVLYQIEQREGVRAVMVERLERMPNWRHGYFMSVDHLVDSASCEARAQIFRAMAKRKNWPDRAEIKPSLDACVRAGEYGLAMDLARSVTGTEPWATLNNDPDFDAAAALSAQGRWHVLPGEWQLTNHRGLKVSAMQREGHSYLAIRWNGRGAPVYLRQFVYLGQVTRPELQISVAGDQNVDGFDGLRPEWMCPGQSALNFDLKSIDSQKKTAFFALSAPSSCLYGWLRLVAVPSQGSGSVTMNISKVMLLNGADGAATP